MTRIVILVVALVVLSIPGWIAVALWGWVWFAPVVVGYLIVSVVAGIFIGRALSKSNKQLPP